ncbi:MULTISPECIES: hypothetical protein [unclassified Streptomyces]|uniref:hypothetical protein n=1 Tax=unclassified Streptomyces TaxID=2593676 RepID=UPI0019055FC2|nr:hypothetical protein [Streptomyces sp. HSG2]
MTEYALLGVADASADPFLRETDTGKTPERGMPVGAALSAALGVCAWVAIVTVLAVEAAVA